MCFIYITLVNQHDVYTVTNCHFYSRFYKFSYFFFLENVLYIFILC